MSTLEYLDPHGTVNFSLVSWKTLNVWLSSLNGVPNLEELPKGINRGKVIAELERRRNKTSGVFDRGLGLLVNRGNGLDWRDYENEQNFTHLEELLIFQPKEWRLQAREYMFRFQVNVDRHSKSSRLVTKLITSVNKSVTINMDSPILVVLFHPEMSGSKRFGPLCFLQAYDVENPFPRLLTSLARKQVKSVDQTALMEDLSPVEYYLAFAESVQMYDRDKLLHIGKQCSFPRLVLMKEFDFCTVIGQRLAKHMIRAEVVNFFLQRIHQGNTSPWQAPLCMIFAGPSGNGKTELAMSLATLLNKPGEDSFLKIDCGKVTHANELFGMSGAYQGSEEGSALNNFVLRLSQDPMTLGVVLLDKIEKADKSVIHGLYQVIDKGEWTNKKLESKKAQT
jgi:AAA domain (Cdc48 subfamily)